MLFTEMKFDIETSNLRAGDVDLFAVNPAPITGARIYVRGVFHPPLGLVGEDEVRIALDTARAEMAGKAVVVTPGAFTPDARASAQGAPVDLLDGPSLLGLVKKHLPQVFAQQHL
jgi:restriction system protein